MVDLIVGISAGFGLTISGALVAEYFCRITVYEDRRVRNYYGLLLSLLFGGGALCVWVLLATGTLRFGHD